MRDLFEDYTVFTTAEVFLENFRRVPAAQIDVRKWFIPGGGWHANYASELNLYVNNVKKVADGCADAGEENDGNRIVVSSVLTKLARNYFQPATSVTIGKICFYAFGARTVCAGKISHEFAQDFTNTRFSVADSSRKTRSTWLFQQRIARSLICFASRLYYLQVKKKEYFSTFIYKVFYIN